LKYLLSLVVGVATAILALYIMDALSTFESHAMRRVAYNARSITRPTVMLSNSVLSSAEFQQNYGRDLHIYKKCYSTEFLGSAKTALCQRSHLRVYELVIDTQFVRYIEKYDPTLHKDLLQHVKKYRHVIPAFEVLYRPNLDRIGHEAGPHVAAQMRFGGPNIHPLFAILNEKIRSGPDSSSLNFIKMPSYKAFGFIPGCEQSLEQVARSVVKTAADIHPLVTHLEVLTPDGMSKPMINKSNLLKKVDSLVTNKLSVNFDDVGTLNCPAVEHEPLANVGLAKVGETPAQQCYRETNEEFTSAQVHEATRQVTSTVTTLHEQMKKSRSLPLE
jgi:hypothetical protein